MKKSKNFPKNNRKDTRVRVFWAVSKKKPDGELQGIIYPDGTIALGVDAWRSMDKSDFPSYPIEEFENIDGMKKVYRFIKMRKPYYCTG